MHNSHNIMEQSTETIPKTSPRTTYLCEPRNSNFANARRVISLTFSYDVNGDIYYGASIFHRNGPNDFLQKHTIRETSIARYKMAPVHINMTDFSIAKFKIYYPTKHVSQEVHVRKNENLPQFEDVIKTIRKAMYSHGVSNRHQNVTQ
jgi:hypothetical protein